MIGIASLAARMMARNPRLGKNLITLFRGESFPQRITVKAMKDSAKHFKTTFAAMKRDKLGGQWYTPNPEHAAAYASGLLEVRFSTRS